MEDEIPRYVDPADKDPADEEYPDEEEEEEEEEETAEKPPIKNESKTPEVKEKDIVSETKKPIIGNKSKEDVRNKLETKDTIRLFHDDELHIYIILSISGLETLKLYLFEYLVSYITKFN